MTSTGGSSPGLLWHAVARNLGWLLASNALMALLSLVYIGIATRSLGLADFGRFALITGTAQTIATLVGFETWRIVVRFGVEQGEADEVAQLQRAAALIEGGSALIGMLLVGLLFAVWHTPFGLSASLAPYAAGYSLVQLATVRSTPTGILRLRDRFHLAAVADSVQPVVRLIGALAALAVSPTIKGFLIAWAVAEVATLVAYWATVAISGDLRPLLAARVSLAACWRRYPDLGRMLLSANVQSSLSLASRQAPLLVVGGYAGPAAAGAFRLAVQLANALSKLSILLTRAAFPEIVRSIRQASRDRFARVVLGILAACLAAAALVMLIVALLGRPLLALVGGDAFASGYVYLLWLAGAGAVELAASSFEPILFSVGRAVTASLARALAVAAQVAVMLALLPIAGALGASISVFVGAIAAGALLGLALYRYASRHGLDQTA